MSEETKQKISSSNLGKSKTRKSDTPKRVMSEETKAKISNALKGKTVSLETKAKLSAARKDKVMSEETKAKIRSGLIKYWSEVIWVDMAANYENNLNNESENFK